MIDLSDSQKQDLFTAKDTDIDACSSAEDLITDRFLIVIRGRCGPLRLCILECFEGT
jgi:hypothetical protein